LLKHLHQKGRSTVDWSRWRHDTTAQTGPAPESCIGPRTCWGRPCWLYLCFPCAAYKLRHSLDLVLLTKWPVFLQNESGNPISIAELHLQLSALLRVVAVHCLMVTTAEY